MVERSAVMGGGLVAGLTALMSGESVAAAPASDDSQLISGSIDQLRNTFEGQFDQTYGTLWRGVARIRQQQRTWIKSTMRYPEFIEVGLDIWDNMYDWHVVNQQPLSVGRAGDGHYTMVFMFTTLVLRPEQQADYVGFPYDSRQRQ